MIIKPSQPGVTSTQVAETTSATGPSATQESTQQFTEAMDQPLQSKLEKFAQEHPELQVLLNSIPQHPEDVLRAQMRAASGTKSYAEQITEAKQKIASIVDKI